MQIIKRVLRGLVILLVALFAILAGSVVVDYAIGADRLDEVTNISIPGTNGGPDVRAYVAQPAGAGPFPAVIMIHEFFGLDEATVSKANMLAEEGYLVIAPDTFRGSTTSWIPRAIYQVISTPPENVNADLDTVFAWLEAQGNVAPDRIAISGFCYGGRTSLTYSLHNSGLAATVIYYGVPETDPALLTNLPGPVLGIFGGADQSIPVAQVEAFDAALAAAGVPHEITIYAGEPHAFVRDAEGIRAGGAQAEAWGQMLVFLETHLGGGSAIRPSPGPSENGIPIAWKYYLMLVYEHTVGTASHAH